MALSFLFGIVSASPVQAQAADGEPVGFANGVTGGEGGPTVRASTGTEIHAALCNRASNDSPIVIEVEGTITVENTTKERGSCNTSDTRIDIREVSNVSIIGVEEGALFDEIGIRVRTSSNIIIQNVTVRNVKKTGSPVSNDGDAIGMERETQGVWVDHVTLEASGGEDEGYDSLFDLKRTVEDVTLSYSILRNAGRGGLIGSNESDTTSNNITYHHNIYDNIESRVHLVRGARVHMYNNYFNGIVKSGINSRAGASVLVENNYFHDSNSVLGTFYTDQLGIWQAEGNTLDNVTWNELGTTQEAGPSMISTGSVSVPYSYELDATSCVPGILARLAGANKGNRVSNGSCSRDDENLSLADDAGADGSSRSSTSFGDAIDGDLSTFWSPNGNGGRISVKWDSPRTVGGVIIKESPGTEGTIGTWVLVNNDTDIALASGDGVGDIISFPPVSLEKLDFFTLNADGSPEVAEFEVYATGDSGTGDPGDGDPGGEDPGDGDPGDGDPGDEDPGDEDPGDEDPGDEDPGDEPGTLETVFVAPNGSSDASGTIDDPTTLESAIVRVISGGTILMRGGTYDYSTPIIIEIGNDGSPDNRTSLRAYEDEVPVLDFSAMVEDSANRGLSVNGDFWHVYGIVVQRAGDNGIFVGGNDNIIERTVTRFNRDTGLQIARPIAGAARELWPTNNLVLSAVSHDNEDSDGEDADGFAAKLTVGDGNVFRYSVAYNNVDDGWDLYTRERDGEIGVVTIEDSLAFGNGTLTDGSSASNGDKNGFKLGGEDIAVDHIVRNNIAWRNGKDGFTFNRNTGSIQMTDNVSIDSVEENFDFSAGSHRYSGNTSCFFELAGANDVIVGTETGPNNFYSGSNSDACSEYEGNLSWGFDSSGVLNVDFG